MDKIEYILDKNNPQNILNSIVSQTLFALDQQTPNDEGTDYKTLYYSLFNGITDIIKNANTYERTVAALKQLQCMAEDAYIDQG